MKDVRTEGRSGYFLLVEDDPDDQFLTLEALRLTGRADRVVTVADGAEALDFLFCEGKYAARDPNDRPGLVLLDLKLPKVGGLEVLHRIRGDARTKELPLVVLTSSDELDDLDASWRLGADSYVLKSVDFADFCDTVRLRLPGWLRRIRSGKHLRFGG